MLKKINKPLLLILLTAIFFRLSGISHGFPFITHPDEPSVIRSALGIRFSTNPGHFDWPHLYFYLNFVIYFLFIKARGILQIIGFQESIQSLFPLIWRDPLVFYYISRVLSALLGGLTIIPIYLTGKKLFSEHIGLFSALVFALFPFHIWHSHYALIDVPTTFFVAWACYFSARIIVNRSIKDYILAGLFVGFAASTKYNGGLSALLVVLAHLLREDLSLRNYFNLGNIKSLFLSGFASMFGFFIGTPYSVFDFETFTGTDSPNGAFWQFKNVGSVDFLTQVKQFFEVLVYKLSDDMGYTFLIVFFLVIFYVLFQQFRSRKISKNPIFLFIITSLFVMFYISGFEKTRSHYYLMTYPYISLVCGYGIAIIYDKFVDSTKFHTYTFLLIIFLVPLYFSVVNIIIFNRGDTRNVLYSWMQKNVQPMDTLVYESSSLVPVLEKFSTNKRIDGLDSNFLETEARGYVILSLDNEELNEYFNENSKEFSKLQEEDVEFITWIEPHLMLGSNIFVYGFNNE